MSLPPAAPVHETIHPALWRGSQLAGRPGRCVATGHPGLDAELPGRGWPAGTLVDLLLAGPGIGEIRLLRPALAALPPQRRIILLQPPLPPNIACWASWGLDPDQLLWVRPRRPADALWAAEQILKNGSCGALLHWQAAVQHASLRRLHLAAQSSDTLFFMLRPSAAAHAPSPAPLRLALEAAPGGVRVAVLKRRGPVCAQPFVVPLAPERRPPLPVSPTRHATLDRPASAPPEPGRLAPALAG